MGQLLCGMQETGRSGNIIDFEAKQNTKFWVNMTDKNGRDDKVVARMHVSINKNDTFNLDISYQSITCDN